jgi:hypothetical protein
MTGQSAKRVKTFVLRLADSFERERIAQDRVDKNAPADSPWVPASGMETKVAVNDLG